MKRNPIANINHIPWKYVLGMNLAILVLASTFLSINTINRNTETRSQASTPSLPAPETQILVDPANPPALTAPDPEWAKVGDAILIQGKNLGTKPFGTVSIGAIAIPHENLVDWQPEFIVFTVPENAVTAPISITASNTLGQPYTLTSAIPLTITTVNLDPNP
jgi:hypothetical protein